MNNTYLTTEELSERIKYDARTIRQCLKDSVLLEGKHYIRPFILSWLHRDRQMQADKLIDTSMASIGPEPDTTYTAEFYAAGGSTPLAIEDGIIGTESAPWTPPADGNYRLELFSERAGIPSWQRFVHSVTVGGHGAAVDPYWEHVVALLHFDGDYTDETGRVWSAIPSPAFESGAGVGGSAALAGAVFTAFSADLNLLNSDFTVEFFVRANNWGTWVATSADSPPIAFGNMAHQSFSNHWSFGPTSSGRLALFAHNNNNSRVYLTTSGTIPTNVLTHVALMRQGNQILMSIGGTVEVVGSVGQIVLGTTNPFTVGRHNNVTRAGLQDELRITKGVARYTENFAPPTAPFPNG